MHQNQKILIVDDEPRNQRIAVETIEGVGDFKLASNGEEALALAETYVPDLVLLDIMMPGMDGYEVCKRIKANPKMNFTKVILVSGKAMIEERLKGYETGADDYMTKPFISEELLAKAKVFLRLVLIEKQLAEMNRSLEEKVTERTRQLLEAEAKMVNVAKMSALGEMAGGIAHEINTPLATISLLADQAKEMVKEEPFRSDQVSKMMDTIASTVKRISIIISGLRTFSRDTSQDAFSSTEPGLIIQNTLSLCQERIKNNDISIQVAPIPDGLQLRCRPVQISQVLLNLIGNSCDAVASLPEKWIKITAERKDDLVRILVTDSGKGLPAAIQDKVFQPFFTTKDIGKGTGLGLSISAGIMTAHGGRVFLDASSENTRFILECPIAPPEQL